APGAVDAVVEVLREVADEALTSLGPTELLRLLAGLDESARLVEVARSRVLTAVERTEAWRTDGKDASLAAWRSRTTRSGQGKAHRELGTARTLAQVPGATEALASGELTSEQVEAIARVATTGGAEQRSHVAEALANPESSRSLLQAAKHLDAPRFARAAQAWAARLDPLSVAADHETQRRARFFSVADTPGGTVIKGRLDRMAGHRLRLALEAVTPVPSADDDRDAGQRAADALDTLAQGALSDPGSKSGAHVTPHVSLMMSAETLAGMRALAESPNADAVSAPGGPGDRRRSNRVNVPGHSDPATLEDGTPVAPSETARILCDAAITRIVLDAESVPLGLGRTKRLWSGAQRRLVIARDRHCAFPGCEIPPRWCEIHHVRWWARDNGRTDVDNAVLVWTTHHGMVHAQDLTLTRTAAPPGVPGARVPLVSHEIARRARDLAT